VHKNIIIKLFYFDAPFSLLASCADGMRISHIKSEKLLYLVIDICMFKAIMIMYRPTHSTLHVFFMFLFVLLHHLFPGWFSDDELLIAGNTQKGKNGYGRTQYQELRSVLLLW
jgi:hypothetical protein